MNPRGEEPPAAAFRVLVADDQALVREALAEALSAEPDLEVVATARDAQEAIALALATEPNVVVLDVNMPAGGGPRACRHIRAALPEVAVVALSALGDRASREAMAAAGAVHYVVKGVDAEALADLIRSVGSAGPPG